MKKFFLGILLSACLIIFLFSCKNTKSNLDNTIIFDSIVVSKHIPLLDVNDTTLPYSTVNIKFSYPVKFRSEEDLKQLQKIFVGSFMNDISYDSLPPKEALDKYLADYEKDYKALSKDFNEDRKKMTEANIPSWYFYDLSIENHILFQNDSLLSYSVEYSDYTGGAHGSHRILYYNVDLNEVVTISEEDLFVPNFKKPLSKIIVNALMKKYNVSSPDSLLAQGFFNLEDIVPNNNFWMDDKALHYTFNQYEIAPYVMGAIDVEIPYSDLKTVLKPNNVVERFFIKKE